MNRSAGLGVSHLEDIYRSIAGRALHEIKVKGSRFIAAAIPVPDEIAARAEIEIIRKREYKATHVCTAYRIGPTGGLARYDDAGEPSGTAGPPILRQIDARSLTNTLVAVTRYFGGTKLGTGGLIRAYGDAAAGVLDACTVEEHVIRIRFRLRFAYTDTSPVMHVLSGFDTEIRDTRYAEDTELIIAVRRSQAEAFQAAYHEALSGRSCAERMEDSG